LPGGLGFNPQCSQTFPVIGPSIRVLLTHPQWFLITSHSTSISPVLSVSPQTPPNAHGSALVNEQGPHSVNPSSSFSSLTACISLPKDTPVIPSPLIAYLSSPPIPRRLPIPPRLCQHCWCCLKCLLMCMGLNSSGERSTQCELKRRGSKGESVRERKHQKGIHEGVGKWRSRGARWCVQGGES
jgi:hypothetical protein